MSLHEHLQLYLNLGLTPVPLRFRSKQPLVRWGDAWSPTRDELEKWFVTTKYNIGVRCGEALASIDCDSEDAYRNFIATHHLPSGCPIVKTSRGYHIWLKPEKPVKSQCVGGVEIKCLGSYVVAPPSIHPSGVEYCFEKPLNGSLPEVDLDQLFGLAITEQRDGDVVPSDNSPSEFALRYGKSPYPQALCGLATKVLTRPDGQAKKFLSLRCWKWHCPKCAPLLMRYQMNQLSGLSFRFILKLPNMDKPTTFLRRAGKPSYVHIVSNGESWLFLTDGQSEKVWSEAKQAGYELIAGDISGDPSAEEIRESLKQALCREEEPLNTRRKITHRRDLFSPSSRDDKDNESKCNSESEENGKMSSASGEEQPRWTSEVVMKPINEVAREHEAEGWRILWKSEVEAVAIKGSGTSFPDMDIVELMETLGIKLKKVGGEYKALCPFHNDSNPSLSVNGEKGLWHCFGCGRGGDVRKFIEEWQRRDKPDGGNPTH